MQTMMERLEGTWAGEGRGEYPTIENFTYSEEITLIRLADKPILAYTQRTRSPDGKPLHVETGYYRFGDNGVELVIAQPTGIVEVHEGRVEGNRIAFHQVGLASAPTAVEVEEVRRTLKVDGDVLSYTLDMAAVGQPLTFHLEAQLQRQA
jgi:hypothetical protein